MLLSGQNTSPQRAKLSATGKQCVGGSHEAGLLFPPEKERPSYNRVRNRESQVNGWIRAEPRGLLSQVCTQGPQERPLGTMADRPAWALPLINLLTGSFLPFELKLGHVGSLGSLPEEMCHSFLNPFRFSTQPSFPLAPALAPSLPLPASGPKPTKRDSPGTVSRASYPVLAKKGFSTLKTTFTKYV